MRIDEFRDHVHLQSLAKAMSINKTRGIQHTTVAFPLLKSYEMDPGCIIDSDHAEIWKRAGELVTWCFDFNTDNSCKPKWWKEKIR